MERVRKKAKTRPEFRTYEYLIYFVDREDLGWWDLFTREGFRHCFVLQWCEWSYRWICVDWRQSHTDFIVFFDFEVESMLAHIRSEKGTVVRFWGTDRPDGGGWLVTYCSNIISRYLGLGNSIILTPYQLYRRLLKSGGEVVFDWRDHDAEETQSN